MKKLAMKKIKGWAIVDEESKSERIWGYAAHFEIHATKRICKSIVKNSGHGKIIQVEIKPVRGKG